MHRPRKFPIGIVLVLVASTAAAAEQDLLQNGDFSDANQLLGWVCSGTPGSLTAWSTDDAAASGNSGSMELSAVFYIDPISMTILPGLATCISTCFGVRGGAADDYGGQSRLTLGFASIAFTCNAYATRTGCTGDSVALSSPSMSATTSWNGSPATVHGALLSSAHWAQCVVEAVSTGTGTAHFDNLYFDSDTADVIFADGFDTQ